MAAEQVLNLCGQHNAPLEICRWTCTLLREALPRQTQKACTSPPATMQHAAEGPGKLQVYGKSPVPPESIDFVDCLTKCAAQ